MMTVNTVWRVVAWVLSVVTAVMLMSVPVWWVVAIWTVGSNTNRLVGTGVIALLVGAVLMMCAASAWDEVR